MKRLAFKMKLKQGCIEEYIRRHNEIWPKLKVLLQNSGITDYSVFFDEETHILFGVQKVSGSENSQVLGNNEIVKKWWEYMADIMETNPDNSPVTIPLKEVFYMN